MKQMLIGFILGVVMCLSMGAELYHPVRSIITRTESNFRPDITSDFKAVLMNQETIYNLIKDRCHSN